MNNPHILYLSDNPVPLTLEANQQPTKNVRIGLTTCTIPRHPYGTPIAYWDINGS